MNPTTKRRSEAGDVGLVVHSNWSTGPRTTAWVRLGRLMLNGLDREPTAGAAPQIGREDADG